MLVSLHVKNLALMEEAEVEFGKSESSFSGSLKVRRAGCSGVTYTEYSFRRNGSRKIYYHRFYQSCSGRKGSEGNAAGACGICISGADFSGGE